MTCHVAIQADDGDLVLLSDSLGSSSLLASHGHQKQYASDTFVVGVAGDGVAGDIVLRHLHENPSSQSPEQQLTIAARECLGPGANVSFALCTAAGVQQFHPQRLKRPSKPGRFSSLGSGALFVHEAREIQAREGTVHPLPTLEHALVLALSAMGRASRSPTVDDRYMVTLIKGGKTYQIGDPALSPGLASESLKQIWKPELTNRYEQLCAACEMADSEARNLHAIVAQSWRVGELPTAAWQQIRRGSKGVKVQIENVGALIDDLCAFYDGHLRP